MASFTPTRHEMNVSFSQSAAQSGDAAGQLWTPTSRATLSNSISAFDTRSRSGTRGRPQQAVRADSIRRSEGRRMSQDTRRYMQAAAASSQATVQQLLSRLQAYKTFEPFLSAPAPYRESSVAGGRGASPSSVGLSRSRTSAGAVSVAQLWQMVDGLLDTSVAHLQQHNAEGHFITTLQSTLGINAAASSVAKIRTIIESRKPTALGPNSGTSEGASEDRTPPGGPRQPPSFVQRKPGAGGAASAVSFSPSSAFMDRWAADHPLATAAEVEEQRLAWAALDQRRQQTSRTFYLRAMQEQLDALQAEEVESLRAPRMRRESARGGHHRTDLPSPGSADDVFDHPRRGSVRHGSFGPSSREEEASAAAAEAEKQRLLWQTFRQTPAGSVGPSVAPHATTAAAAPDAPRIVSAYVASDDLHDWLHSSWAHRTHRHESAALRIQCAYRVYRSRCEVREMRYARRQAFLASLSAETEARRAWDVALQVQSDATATVTSTDGTLRALQFFINKVNAVVAKRRARKAVEQRQEAEIRRYAARRIQAMYRGHRARVWVEELRHPEIAALREQIFINACATMLQAWCRGRLVRLHFLRVRRAATLLQSIFRCRAARRLLAQRRYERDVADAEQLQRFAVHRIERWYAACLAVRNALGGAHMAELLMLQRVCRGFQARQHAMEEARLSRVRAAAQVIEDRRRRLLDVRAAIVTRSELGESRAAHREVTVRDDAAVTIQRAWRRRRTPFVF